MTATDCQMVADSKFISSFISRHAAIERYDANNILYRCHLRTKSIMACLTTAKSKPISLIATPSRKTFLNTIDTIFRSNIYFFPKHWRNTYT